MKAISSFFALLAFSAASVPAGAALVAGQLDGLTADDIFPSEANLTLELLPPWGGPATAPITAFEPNTLVRRELNAHLQTSVYDGGSQDTIDTEIISMSLAGTALGFNTQIRVGGTNGFAPNLPATHGQVREYNAIGNTNGALEVFDADSIFDVFFDLWVDLNNDNIVDFANSEVLRSEHALRMRNLLLSGLPPALDRTDAYVSGFGRVLENNPDIGTFLTIADIDDIFLFPIDAAGVVNGPAHALLRTGGAGPVDMHTPIPEPSRALLSLVGGIAAIGLRRRRS